MRVRNVHSAMVAGLEPGEDGTVPRTPPLLLLVRGGLLEELARVDVPTPPPPDPDPGTPELEPRGGGQDPGTPALERLQALTAKQARAAVRDITDMDLLGRWLAGGESRSTVLRALEARLEVLGGRHSS